MNTTSQTNAVMLLRARHLGSDDQHSRAIERAMIAAQRQRCRQAADQLNAHLVREYVEYSGTGAIDKRPQLQLLLDELRMLRDVRYVIVSAGDRFTRQVSDWRAIQFELEAAGAELVIASEVFTREEVSL